MQKGLLYFIEILGFLEDQGIPKSLLSITLEIANNILARQHQNTH